MAALTGLFISQSYGGVIHLSTNTGIATGSSTQLQDGFGTNLGVYFNGAGNVTATTFTGLASNATSATSASYANVATSASYSNNSTSASYAVTASFALNVPVTASYANNATSASYANNATSASYANNATSASYALNTTSASYALTTTSASYSLNTTSASYAVSTSLAANSILLNGTASSVFTTTGSNTFVGNQTISGSTAGIVRVLTISSQTASMDLSTADLFTLTLVSGSTTFLNPTNIKSGQTAMLQITQAASGLGTLSWPSTVTFPSGYNYSATTVTSSVDLISFVSFNNSSLRGIPANQFI
jgi:hypothetical protein